MKEYINENRSGHLNVPQNVVDDYNAYVKGETPWFCMLCGQPSMRYYKAKVMKDKLTFCFTCDSCGERPVFTINPSQLEHLALSFHFDRSERGDNGLRPLYKIFRLTCSYNHLIKSFDELEIFKNKYCVAVWNALHNKKKIDSIKRNSAHWRK